MTEAPALPGAPGPSAPERPDRQLRLGQESPRRSAEVVGVALRRMRVIAAALLLMQFLTYRPGPGDPVLPASPAVVGVALALAAVVVSVISMLGERVEDPRLRRLLGMAEIAADAAIVLVLATSLDVTGRNVMWVLLVVPVLEAALRYRLRGAMIVWGVIAVAYVFIELRGAASSEAQLLVAAEAAVQHIGVVLLITVPAGYLSEQLLIDIRAQRNAWQQAAQRSELLEAVAEAGHRVTSLDVEVAHAVTAAARGLGFDAVDMAVHRGEGEWFVTGTQAAEGVSLPGPEEAAGGVRTAVTDRRTIVVEAGDHTPQAAGLERHGLAALMVSPLLALDGSVALRAGVRPGSTISTAQHDCLQLLAAQAGVALRNGQLVAQQRAMQQQLEHRAFHDGLTGLPNRARFLQLLEASLSRPAPDEEHVAVLFVDLDRFKPVNDSLGHDAGNELLIAVAGRLAGEMSGGDVVARLGGDEFVVLLDHVPGADAAIAVARRVLSTLTQPFQVAGHEVLISASVGVAVASRPFENAGELLRRADQAMYRAKGEGRSRWAVYAPGHDTASLTRLQLVADLRTAIDRDQLAVVYQPVVQTFDQAVVSVEALVRWQHPRLGSIPPDWLIPIAEESGLIVDLGRWVLRAAARDFAAWRPAPRATALSVAVNVSASQLSHPSFLSDLDGILVETGFPPRSLLLEVTENVASQGPELVALLRDLRTRGIRLALDDFGQGQTSLRHLRELPLDVLKVDKAFVDRLEESTADQAIVRSVVALAHELGLRVIAEGIENERQLQLLQEFRADYLQGFLIHRPVGAAQIAALLGLPSPSRASASPAPAPAAPASPPGSVPLTAGSQA